MKKIAIVLAAAALAPMVAACGDDRMERGLTPATEEAVPMDPAEMNKTQAERDEEQIEEGD
jgi:hypothetical protein